jgi:mTERF
VGLTLEEVKNSALIQPAVLQYGMDNLQAKLDFFRNDLFIDDPKTIAYMVACKPKLWGLSLDKNLRLTVAAMQSYLGISPTETGEILGRAPALLLFTWGSNLEPKLDFLTSRLGLSPEQRKQILLHQPRILTFSLHKSLDAKITMIEEHLTRTHQRQNSTTVRDVILNNPSLLVMSKAALETRFLKSGVSAEQIGRAKRCVVKLSMNGTVQREFSSVKEAAKSARTSASRMYQVIRQGHVFGDVKYAYQQRPGEALSVARTNTEEKVSGTAHVSIGDNERHDGFERDTIMPLDNGHYDSTTSTTTSTTTTTTTSTTTTTTSTSSTTDVSYLRIYASARVFPPDGTTQARGLRRGGGIAVVMPGLPPSLARICEQAMEEGSQGQLLSLNHDRQDDGELVLALSGFPLLRPSRRRCSLFACLVALRVASQFCRLILSNEQAANNNKPKESAAVNPPGQSLPNQIDIVTDSSYVFGLLKDRDRLLEWANARTQLEFVYDGDESTAWANTDIIWPLSRAYNKLVSGDDANLSDVVRGNNKMTVRFVLQAKHSMTSKEEYVNHVRTSVFRRQVDSWAKEAASVQYQRLSIAEGSP